MDYWFTFGIVALISLTYQDFKNHMNIDDRYNFFMAAMTLSLLTHLERPISYILIGIVTVIVISHILNKMSFIGDGDVSALRWIFLGFFYINVYWLGLFFGYFAAFTVLSYIIATHVFKVEKGKHYPFFLVILVSFIFTYVDVMNFI